MSLWTPSGEHPVDKEPPKPRREPLEPSGDVGPAGPVGQPPPGSGEGEGAGHGEAAAVVDELRRQLADAPAEVVIANHCYGLFELAAVYLSQSPPLLPQAQLAIDALGCLIDGLGERLGEAHAALKDAVTEVRLAYVQLQKADDALRQAGDGAASPG